MTTNAMTTTNAVIPSSIAPSVMIANMVLNEETKLLDAIKVRIDTDNSGETEFEHGGTALFINTGSDNYAGLKDPYL